MNGQPKPAFYIAAGAVVVALIAFAVYRSDVIAPKAKPKTVDPIVQPTLPIPFRMGFPKRCLSGSITTA